MNLYEMNNPLGWDDEDGYREWLEKQTPRTVCAPENVDQVRMMPVVNRDLGDEQPRVERLRNADNMWDDTTDEDWWKELAERGIQ